MASSTQVAVKVVTNVKPEDFMITWGLQSQHWRLATPRNPTAELLRVGRLEVLGKVEIDPLKRNSVVVTFEVCKTSEQFGWDNNANIRMGARVALNGVGQLGEFEYKSVNDQLVRNNIPEQKFLVTASFDLEPNPAANDKYLYFGLFGLGQSKRGLRFYEATVQVAET